MTEWTLKDGERLDDLVRDGMRLIQRPDQFCFSVDSVLLAHYVKPKAKDRIADLGQRKDPHRRAQQEGRIRFDTTQRRERLRGSDERQALAWLREQIGDLATSCRIPPEQPAPDFGAQPFEEHVSPALAIDRALGWQQGERAD